MVALKPTCSANADAWQTEFLPLLPEIRRRLRKSFLYLNPEAREEATAEGVVHCLLWYTRIHARGRGHLVTPGSLAFYAARQVKCGRPAAGRINSADVMSRYAQYSHHFQRDLQQGTWIDELAADKRASIPDQVAAKLDVRAWWRTLSDRVKTIASDLAIGCSTSEVARRHGVSAGRVSQLRRTLAESWATFQGESGALLSGAVVR